MKIMFDATLYKKLFWKEKLVKYMASEKSDVVEFEGPRPAYTRV